MKKRRRKVSLIKTLVILAVIATLGGTGWWLYSGQQGSAKADSVMRTLAEIVPGLGDDSADSTGVGRDPLAAISIEGIDIVGVLEIPALDINAPVTSKDYSEEYFASWLDGSPVQGHFMVKGGRDDLFRKLAGRQGDIHRHRRRAVQI